MIKQLFSIGIALSLFSQMLWAQWTPVGDRIKTSLIIPRCWSWKAILCMKRNLTSRNLKNFRPGSGIGLMLVYKLVKLHKGKIQIQSAENQGYQIKEVDQYACFRFGR